MLRKMAEEKKMLIEELTQGRELAVQLNQLDPVESQETCQALLEKIVSTYEKARTLLRGLKRGADQVETFHQTPAGHTNQVVTRDQYFPNDAFKKRKTVTRWNEEMSVFSAADGEDGSPMDDGYRWRKYGQKLILGAKFPRAYYRCTYSKTSGCLATKKVQRSDYDSSTFQISYKGHHTCIQSSISSSSDIPIISNAISKFNPQTDLLFDQSSRIQTTPSDALRNLQQGLKVETEIMSFMEENNPFIQIESAENLDNELFWNLFVKDDPDLGGGVLRSSESEYATDMNLTPTSVFESPFGFFC